RSAQRLVRPAEQRDSDDEAHAPDGGDHYCTKYTKRNVRSGKKWCTQSRVTWRPLPPPIVNVHVQSAGGVPWRMRWIASSLAWWQPPALSLNSRIVNPSTAGGAHGVCTAAAGAAMEPPQTPSRPTSATRSGAEALNHFAGREKIMVSSFER